MMTAMSTAMSTATAPLPIFVPSTPGALPPISSLKAVADFYHEHGFYIAKGAVDPTTLAPLLRDFDRVVEQITRNGAEANARWDFDTTTKIDNDKQTVVIHTHQIQKFSAAWARFCFHEDFLDLCEALIGPDIILHHSKLFLKPAGRGAAFPPHQDHNYFPTISDSMFAAVLYLTPSNEDNGCVRVWPGSHRLGPIADSAGGNAAMSERFPFATSIPAIAEPGDLVFFHYCTVHASLANRGNQARKSVLFQLHAGNDQMVDGQGHPSSNLVLRGWNERMTRNRAGAG